MIYLPFRGILGAECPFYCPLNIKWILALRALGMVNGFCSGPCDEKHSFGYWNALNYEPSILNCKTEVVGDKHFCHFSYEREYFAVAFNFLVNRFRLPALKLRL